MKKIFIITAIASIALAAACTDRTDIPSGGEDTIAISLQFSEPATKSTPVGNEGLITSVDYFFYADETTAPSYHARVDGPELDSDNNYTISLKAGSDGVPDYSTLLKDGKCTIFAVYNYPGSIADAPLADVKALAAANTFSYGVTSGNSTTWYVTPDDNASGEDKYFIMTGQETLSLTMAGLGGKVDMKRLAAKVSVVLNIAESVTGTDESMWKPILGGNNVRLYLCNYVQNAVLGAVDPLYPGSYTQADYATYVINSDIEATGDNYVINDAPDFYSYPIEWTSGDDSEPYIKLILPWKKVDSNDNALSQKELYYKIMFPKSITSLDANKHYQLTVNVSVLGTEGEPTVELTAEKAQVIGWVTSGKVNPVISAAKYLSVEKENITFYTTSTGTSFAASDKVTFELVSVYQENLKTGETEYLVKDGEVDDDVIASHGFTSGTLVKNSESDTYYTKFNVVGNDGNTTTWVELDNSVSYLQAGHTLNKDLTSQYMDVTPYYYVVKLHLNDEADSDYDRTVTFVQYPEVYVLEDPNSQGDANTNYGYVFLNTYTGTDRIYNTTPSNEWNYKYSTILSTGNSNYCYLGNVRGLQSSNNNPIMYILTISVSDTYNIGDPRSTEVSSPSFTYTGAFSYNGTIYPATYDGSWNTALWTEGGSHALTYYHPASSENTSNMIAPKIRVASSYGACMNGITKTNAIARCAAYQEDGIPAGRWRLPTLAEVEFISTLSTNGRIPYLFGNTSSAAHYWTANGLIEVDNVNKKVKEVPYDSKEHTPTVRCVYDEWFWGDATTRPVDPATFTWGDRDY